MGIAAWLAMSSSVFRLLVGLTCLAPKVHGGHSHENPIRHVVTLLQNMQASVTAEGKKEEALYQKFMCYCKTGGETLAASIAAAKAKIESIGAEIKAASEKKKQTEQDLKEHQASRA